MIFTESKLQGAYIIQPELIEDGRGFLARTFCRREFETYGMHMDLAQCNISFNIKAGTLRGMHFQAKPREEAKLVRCTRGAIYDVGIDLRAHSSTYKRWFATELTAENRRMLYIPEGFAHGFQTLVDNVEIFYQMAEFYHPELAHGVRWNDPVFGIRWPIDRPTISPGDAQYPDFI